MLNTLAQDSPQFESILKMLEFWQLEQSRTVDSLKEIQFHFYKFVDLGQSVGWCGYLVVFQFYVSYCSVPYTILLINSMPILIIFSKMQSSNLDNIINALKTSFTDNKWQQLLLQLKNKPLQSHPPNNKTPSALESYLRQQCLASKQFWFRKFNEYIRLCYQTKKQLLKVLYRLLPILMQKYIQVNYVKIAGIQECLIDVYNYEYQRYNLGQLEKKELSQDVVIRRLYEKQLGKEMMQANQQALQPIKQINNKSRISMKSLIFYLIYIEQGSYGQQALRDYYRCLFIYCGAEQRDLNTTGSLYLLQKINKVSIFKYSINQDELQWIILTLYELCTQVKKDKFQLLAVINLIHKKVSNQSLFRMSDVCNSLIHLLEDQYSEIFV